METNTRVILIKICFKELENTNGKAELISMELLSKVKEKEKESGYLTLILKLLTSIKDFMNKTRRTDMEFTDGLMAPFTKGTLKMI